MRDGKGIELANINMGKRRNKENNDITHKRGFGGAARRFSGKFPFFAQKAI